MDWPLLTPEFDEQDLNTVFIYRPQGNTAVLRSMGDDVTSESCLETEKQWTSWLADALRPDTVCKELDAYDQSISPSGRPTLAVILARRGDEGGLHNPSILEHLPFGRSTFKSIIESFPLHGGTARVINRSDTAFFTDINASTSTDGPIYYCCRTPSTWPGDLAVSSVFHPKTGFTGGVVFGCSESITEEIAIRIDNSEGAWTHPMLLMGIVAEIERERHLKLVQKRVVSLLQRVRDISRSQKISATSQMHKEDYSVDPWIEVSQLRMAIESWKKQLLKMQAHIDEFEVTILTERENEIVAAIKREDTLHDDWPKPRDTSYPWRHLALINGRRIKKRLQEIICEYEQTIRECTMVIDGMVLSTQLSWSQISYQDTQTNLRIASDTKRDSRDMRSIAFLTMIFLPATFMTSLFSMSFFDFHDPGGDAVSPYLWIYFAATIAVTLPILWAWICWSRRRRKQDVKDEEYGEKPSSGI